MAAPINVPPFLPGCPGNTTASRPSSISIPESSAATLKPKPSLASPTCSGPCVTSQVRHMGGVGAQSWLPGTSSGKPDSLARPGPLQASPGSAGLATQLAVGTEGRPVLDAG